jgi:L-alanine-DL-glutamate epimerase-like enolase superfamily enzyme
VDYVDLDGHLLLADDPFVGLTLVDGVVQPSDAPGLGVQPNDPGLFPGV